MQPNTPLILVIEDSASLREEILEMLGYMNFRGIGADHGRQGVELALEYLPDLIICDITMPELDGYGVLRSLRSTPETSRIPFIFLTAKVERADIREGMNLGADDYLTKPFTSDELNEAIAARLKKYTAVTQPYLDEMKQAAEQLGRMAYRDPLTGLANRIFLHHQLQEAIVAAKRNQDSLAVLCVNIDRFQAINTELGHAAGDTLLQAVAARLTTCLNSGDTAARLSGDEFSLLLTHLNQRGAIAEVIQTIQQALSSPYSLNDQQVVLQFSMGATLYPDDLSPVGKLLNHAVMALNWGRKQGNRHCQFFAGEIEDAIMKRQLLTTHLAKALENSEFQVYYQPQINLITGRIIGAEALLRWQHPEMGFVSPDTFIPITEETGMIIPLGDWVLETVCAQASQWRSSQVLPIRISVNLSAHQFKRPNLVNTFIQALEQTHLPPDAIGIELTESAVMEDVEASIIALRQFGEMGITVAIDDFGTGYSSLSQLKRLPINTLKIDKSFVQNLVQDSNDAAITSAIISLARSLSLRVVAEGVETRGQYDFLRRQGCHFVQGYLFSPAIPAAAFEQLLREDRRLPLSIPESETPPLLN